jgi:hypothetical protein
MYVTDMHLRATAGAAEWELGECEHYLRFIDGVPAGGVHL